MLVIEVEGGDSSGNSETDETPQGKGTMAKNTTSCGNAFVTNILLARGGLALARGKRPPETQIAIICIPLKMFFFTQENSVYEINSLK